MVKAITPQEAIFEKNDSIPDFVLKAFNELIVRDLSGKSSTVKQCDAIALIKKYSPNTVTSETIFKNNWLDVEDVFRKAGWHVCYDKPAYYETYEPYFEFKFKG